MRIRILERREDTIVKGRGNAKAILTGRLEAMATRLQKSDLSQVSDEKVSPAEQWVRERLREAAGHGKAPNLDLSSFLAYYRTWRERRLD